jgi:competence protein ComEA
MKSWWVIVLGVVFGVLSAGILYLASQPPRGNPIVLLPPPTPVPIQVHVSGEMQTPGVYALPPETRVQDAIQAAGGFSVEADTTKLNLAAPLEDGIRLQVPAQPKVETYLATTANTKEEKTPPKPNSPSTVEETSQLNPININTATQEELETLSGIGPATAQKIITFREENGPFTSIEEIQKVSGIGPVTFENIKDFISVDDAPSME